MIANYHTHTTRCNHAFGTEREYIERAIEGGFKVLGFSDHTPMPYDNYVSPYKMGFDQVDDYVTTILDLKQEYKNDIEIHVGLEVEYYPRYFEKLLSLLRDYPIEYFLLGQHFLGNEVNDVVSFDATDDEKVLARFCAQTKEALDTGSFTYFAHPDLMPFTGPDHIYHYHMKDLCEFAKERSIPMELNLLGLWEGRAYPSRRFFKIVSEVGNEVILGSDAHKPELVWNPKAIERAERMAEELHLNLIDTVTLRDPFRK